MTSCWEGGGLHHIHCPENKPKRLLDAIAIFILGKTLENNQNILDIKEMLRGMRVIGLHEKYKRHVRDLRFIGDERYDKCSQF